MKILIIEDDRQVAASLRSALDKNYAVHLAHSGRKGSFLALTNEYDLIILDLNLPDISGLQVCQDLRRESIITPILILTGKNQTESKVVLLNAGADDYLVKPFALNELRARIRALLRRGPQLEAQVLRIGPVSLNPITQTAYCHNQPLQLSKKEYLLLYSLMRQPNVPLSRLQLLEHVWEGRPDIKNNTVDVHICNLRHKLKSLSKQKLIKTVHGTGYVMTATDQAMA